MVHLSFKTVDTAGRESVYSTALYVQNLTKVVDKASAEMAGEISDEKASVKVVSAGDAAYRRGMNVVVLSTSKSTAARWNKDKNVNEKRSPVTLNLEITSETIASDYDAKRAGEKILEEMVKISRKTTNRVSSRR